MSDSTLELYSNSLFEIFNDYELVTEARKAKFVNATFAKKGKEWSVKFNFFATMPAHPRRVPWKDIACTSETASIKRSPCTAGSSKITWFKGANNLKQYIAKISSGKVSKQAHDKLFAVVQKTCGKKFINNNFHVNTLHFKS